MFSVCFKWLLWVCLWLYGTFCCLCLIGLFSLVDLCCGVGGLGCGWLFAGPPVLLDLMLVAVLWVRFAYVDCLNVIVGCLVIHIVNSVVYIYCYWVIVYCGLRL